MSVAIDPALFDRPFAIEGPEDFNALALDLFRLHAAHNPVYRGFLSGLGKRAVQVARWEDIPCLPIGLFKSHDVLIEGLTPEVTFTSSGTTGANTSKHHVPWLSLYERSFKTGFTENFGGGRYWIIATLLPGYQEREGSSLIHMMNTLMEDNGAVGSGSYLKDPDGLHRLLKLAQHEVKPMMLMGVPYALLDFMERYPGQYPELCVMETGGMKGKRKELLREELHGRLKEGFGVERVWSEYGMTELLSQAWSTGRKFHCPPWMQVRVRDVNDPFTQLPVDRTGGIDVFDLCNIGSCPFIATQDLGKTDEDGAFEVLGRFDNSDLRGCNLLVE